MSRKSDVVAGMGVGMSIIQGLVKEVQKRGGTDEDLHRLATPEGEGLLSKIAELIIKRPVFQIWKTIKLGTGPLTADEFCKVLAKSGFGISDWARDILGKPGFTVAAKEQEIDLVVVSVKELGFPDGARRDQIYERAKEYGLELCPPEVGPQLRLQHKDQPLDEWLLIAMEPILDSVGYLKVFEVGHGGDGLWLSSVYGHPGSFWPAGLRWVFCRPRK